MATTTPCENCGRELDLTSGPVRCECSQVNPSPKHAPAKEEKPASGSQSATRGLAPGDDGPVNGEAERPRVHDDQERSEEREEARSLRPPEDVQQEIQVDDHARNEQ